MNLFSDSGDRGAQCQCHPHCVDIATGVLMQRHGVSADEARATLGPTATRHGVTVHAWAREVIDSAVHGRSPDGAMAAARAADTHPAGRPTTAMLFGHQATPELGN